MALTKYLFPVFCLLCGAFGAGAAYLTAVPSAHEVPALGTAGEEVLPVAHSVGVRRGATPQAANPFVPAKAAAPEKKEALGVTEAVLAEALLKRDLTVKVFASGDSADNALATSCKADAERVLRLLPGALYASLEELRLYLTTRTSRGMANAATLELQCKGLTSSERMAVLVHELGHVADLGYVTGGGLPSAFQDGQLSIGQQDKSVQFYSVSFMDSATRKYSVGREDFVSGYAGSSPFEDFAESFAYYVLHGDAFRALAQEDGTLASKYAYIRDTLFGGKEYTGGGVAPKNGERPWDITLLPYDVSVLVGG